MGGLRNISGLLMVAIGAAILAWQLYGLYTEGRAGPEPVGTSFGSFAFSSGLILFGVQRLRQRRAFDYSENAICGRCNHTYKQRGGAGSSCPKCGHQSVQKAAF